MSIGSFQHKRIKGGRKNENDEMGWMGFLGVRCSHDCPCLAWQFRAIEIKEKSNG